MMETYFFTMDNNVIYRNGVKMEKKLNPCPFCGSKDVDCISHPYGFHGNDTEFYCHCRNCNLDSPEFKTEDEAIQYWNNGIIKQKTIEVGYDFDNFITYCGNCGAVVDSNADFYCNKCGCKLEIDEEKENKMCQEHDNKIVHPYGWPLTEKDIVFSIGKPVYVRKHNGEYQWKVVNKIEINDSGYIIKCTDGSNFLFSDICVYDPTDIVKNKLYPKIIKKDISDE